MVLQRLRDLREDNDLTQEAVANLLQVNRRTYSAYENGVNMIPYPCIIELATFYGTSADYILGLTNTKEPYPRK